MQTKKDKFLIDIYFEESKMNVWREKCLKSSEFITSKIKSKSDIIAAEKNKIRNEKKSNILNLKEDWNTIISEYESFANEKENSTQLIITSISDEIKKFRKILNGLRENILNQNNNNNNLNNDIIEEFFDELKLYKTRIPNIKNLLVSLQTNVEEFTEFSERMKNLLIKSSVSINLVFTNYHTIKKNLLEIVEKLGRYSEGIKNLEKDYSYLLNPSQFPEAYNASLIEIKRRIIFNKKITKDFERMKQLVIKENANRKQFIQDYGKYLTHDYVPQLKFSDLELKIELNNSDEVLNLPYILDEEEENTINNNNIHLDYDEVQVSNSENNYLLASNSNTKFESGSNVANSLNNYRIGGIRSIRKNSNGEENSNNNFLNMKKGISENIDNLNNSNRNSEEIIRSLNLKLSEVEIMVKVKEAEIKKLYSKIDQRDRKITNIQSEIDKLSSNFDSLNDNFLKQLTFKEQKLKDKNAQCENLLKIVNNTSENKLESCPFCKDIAINNLDTAGWNNYTYLKDYHEKIIEKNKIMTKLEARFNELVIQTNFLKKTFFNHLNNSIEIKNKEISAIKENYENKLMFLEDLLSQEKNKVEKYLANNANNNQEKNAANLKIANLEEQIRLKDILISQFENKLRESNKQIEIINFDMKKLSAEKDSLEKQNKDMKIRENNLNADIMLKEGRIENFNNELKNFEKITESNKKKLEEKECEALLKLKENTELRNRFDLQVKEIDELKKALECLKINHKEELNDKNRNSQYLIYELNNKLDDLTKQLNDKLRVIEEHKLKNQDLISMLEKKNEEIKNLKDNIDRISKSQQELDILRDKMEQLECFNNNENYKLKKKLEELQTSLYEKEKKIQVIQF